MKFKEAIEVIEKGGLLKVTFYTRKIDRSVCTQYACSSITESSYSKIKEHFGDKLSFSVKFGGITEHYYKLKSKTNV